MPKTNTEVIPGSPLYSHESKIKTGEYYADLKLISAMCLQGILAAGAKKDEYIDEVEHCENAILHAKELLKQLEAKCGQE